MIEEALVSFVVSKLGDFVVGISQSFVEIRNDILWVKGELSMMQALLRDAERRTETDEVGKEWLDQVTNIVFKIEDFLDTAGRRYLLESFDDSTDPIPQDANRPRFDTFVGNLASHGRALYRRTSSIALESSRLAENEITIASIKKEIECISYRAKTYGLQPHHARDDGESSGTTATGITQRRPGYSAPLFEQVELVGFDEDVRQLMDWLLNEDGNIRWSFMCIVGMGGSGKTALAKRVCKLAHSNFDHHLWKIASGYPQTNDFARELDKAFKESRSGKLEEHRYLLVIDDISDTGFCSAIRRTLPLGGRGKVILTSRQNITASLEEENCSVHKIKPLPYELAWELFCKGAFRCSSPPGTCPPYMNDVATEIVERCSGLPLAIVLMGGLLSTKGTIPSKWKDIIQHFDQELLHSPRLESIRHVFEASYYYLPSHLKYCFLYSCLFPKGARIKRKKIIRLWVAQGFVKEQQGRPLEEVADHYFIQLIERSMLEPIFSDFTGEPVSCRVHDIMHALAVSKFKEGFGIFDEVLFNRKIQTRYLAIHHQADVIVSKQEEIKARALLVFKACNNLASVLPRCKFLRVLCLDGTHIDHLPDQVCELWNLTYLGLRETRIEYLPRSLENLPGLETLDVRGTEIEAVPFSMRKIKKLRHLLLRDMKIWGRAVLVRVPGGIDSLHQLQTLSGLKADIDSLPQLAHLTQLKELYVSITSQEEASTLFTSINQIANLNSLKIECRDGLGKYTELMLETLLPLPQYLEKLTLGADIRELPLWFAHFKSLRVLVLVNSMLVFDPLKNLSGLPNLVSLSLFHAYTGEQMGCRQGGFPKLRHLHITSFIELEEWTPIEEGTMPCIKFICIVDCGKLRMLPQGFEQLKTLESLELIEMSQEFIGKLAAEDFYKVQHIPKVTDLLRSHCERNLLDPVNVQHKTLESSGASSSSSPFLAARGSSPLVEAMRKRKLGN